MHLGFQLRYPPSKANWAKASLIWMVIGIALWLFFASSILALLATLGR